ncbi:outer membrane beta-barrel protein [Bradyrhizobium prioriisuperbiae]|uniref:outer membrane beta-barrel protein n=1 Tax=Bradyrhizobium prioriisuperbiae TaxID=2854389 RepID=UPI0028E575A2|nr:outer membrane beta-barrel protein [Bradyrhizobium prioritasuperba]
MKKILLVGASAAALAVSASAQAADLGTMPVKAPGYCDPYKNYSCLDAYLGDDVLGRFFRYYQLEWGHDAAPSDPKAPAGRRAEWPPTPQTTPPMPFTEWPYGGTTNLGVTRPGSADSPLMNAIAHTGVGEAMADSHIQVYGWINAGGNLSTNSVRPGGNAPAAYSYTPNTVQLDQAVIYLERLPDTVQRDHIDWGFRVSAIYGENYRYTTAYGLFSNQLLKNNSVNGFDMPMVYGEVFIPQVLEGLNIRVGRFISVPDIEAQLAPNNYMYSHSMTYTFDNYTNTGIQATLAATKNVIFQFGVVTGTEAMPWHVGARIANPFPNPVFPDSTMLKDPGAQPSITAGIRLTSDSGNDSLNIVADGINNGSWGYNNLQWYGATYYHKFNDQWHLSVEAYTLSQRKVLNAADPAGIVANSGYPFGVQQMPFNSPFLAQCSNPNELTCTARVFAALAYLNYKFTPLDNLSFRGEYFDDQQGQRTGVKTRYVEAGIGWQHWWSPQIEVRPEVSYYKALDALAFNGNSNAGILPTKSYAVIGSADIIVHF